MPSPAGTILIVVAPSGAGKTSLVRALMEARPQIRHSVSFTTRAPRDGERHGEDYCFIPEAEFRERRLAGEFLEWAEVHGNLYGTSRRELEAAQGLRGIIFDIDHQGARQIKCAEPDAVGIFILPPNMATLLERLRGRASEDEDTVQRRFRVARQEIAHYGMFDYVLVNDDIDEATEQLVSIFRAEECRRRRAARLAEELLSEGRDLTRTAH